MMHTISSWIYLKNHPEYPDKVKNIVDIAIVNNE